jgi:hypothetical protein
VTGEPDAVKKVSNDECRALRRTLEAQDEAWGTLTTYRLNGRIMMGQSRPPLPFPCSHKCSVNNAPGRRRAHSFADQD